MNTMNLSIPTPSTEPASRRSPRKIAATFLVVAVGWAGGWFATKSLLGHHSHHAAASAPSTWQPVVLDGSATVRLPAGAEHSTQAVAIGMTPINLDMWQVRSGDVQYVVGRMDAPEGTGLSPEQLLRTSAGGAFDTARAENPQYTDTTIVGVPAVEGSASANGGHLYGAFIVSHGGFYEIMVGGPNATQHDLDTAVNTFTAS